MADIVIQTLTPYLGELAKVAIFITIAGVVIRLAKNAFTKGEISF